MTLMEALKSGKRFSREVWPDWIEADAPHLFTKEDVMAQDWEIQETKIKKKMYQAIYKNSRGIYSLSVRLFDNEQDARRWNG